MAGDLLKAVTTQNMDGTVVNPYPVINADMVHTEEKHLTCPSVSTGSWDISCDDGSITATGSCYSNPVLVSGGFEDWGELACPSGMKVLSGGCEPTTGTKLVQASRPNDAGTGWICGGHGGKKTIYALCSPMPVHQSKVNGGDWTEAKCPSGTKAIGGGCDAHASPHKMEYHGILDDMSGYKCGGHGGSKSVWAICAHDDGLYSTEKIGSDGRDSRQVQCEVGETMVGGGCQAHESPHTFALNGPFKTTDWKCNGFTSGHGGGKTVHATCHTTHLSDNSGGCAVETGADYIGASGDQDVGEALNNADTPDKCCEQCNTNPSCEYFVFTGSSCYLKKNFQYKQQAGSNVVSGKRGK